MRVTNLVVMGRFSLVNTHNETFKLCSVFRQVELLIHTFSLISEEYVYSEANIRVVNELYYWNLSLETTIKLASSTVKLHD